MPADPNDFILCIFPRKDMDSLNHAGKLAAQVAHAANHAAHAIGSNKFGTIHMADWGAWEQSTPQGFGTTIIFGGIVDRDGSQRGLRLSDIKSLVECARVADYPCGIITDPTYPLLDGDTLHAIPVETCGWLFGARQNLAIFTRHLILHPPTSNF